MLKLDGVSKAFAGTPALHPTDLVVEPGSIQVVIGPSGCGKSTLLRLMNGLIYPDEGRVVFEGVELTASNVLELRARMGYVIQEGGLFPHLTARRNVALMADYLEVEAGRIAERLDELADLVKLSDDLLDRYPAQLSGGQRQRVSLMRALMLDPDLLLLDEPLGALDPMIRSDLQDDLRRIFRTLGKTVVMVTHDLSEAAFFAGVIILVKEGRIEQQGTLDDFVNRPASDFVRRFTRAQRQDRTLY